MADSLTIRSATMDDAVAVASLLAELGYPQDVSVAAHSLQLALADPQQAVFVAELAGEVVGLAAVTRLFYFHLGQPIARLSSLVVSETLRSQQLGKRLLQAAEQWAQAQGCVQLELTSSVKRERAHAFYQRAGYVGSALRFVRRLTGDNRVVS